MAAYARRGVGLSLRFLAVAGLVFAAGLGEQLLLLRFHGLYALLRLFEVVASLLVG